MISREVASQSVVEPEDNNAFTSSPQENRAVSKTLATKRPRLSGPAPFLWTEGSRLAKSCKRASIAR